MISREHRFIFLHVPKTGGNAVQTVLLPLTDDRMIATDTQDMVDRFGIVGPVTPFKHATLQDYADSLGETLSAYSVIITLRPPFERMVSLYFSPNRWHGTRPVWDRDDFLKMAGATASTATFLRVGGAVMTPDIVLGFDSLSADFDRMVKQLDLPLADTALPVRNTSAATSDALQAVLSDVDLRGTVEDMFADDIALGQRFGT